MSKVFEFARQRDADGGGIAITEGTIRQAAQFARKVAENPRVDRVRIDGALYEEFGRRLVRAAYDYMDSHPGLDYERAVMAVARHSPDLFLLSRLSPAHPSEADIIVGRPS